MYEQNVTCPYCEYENEIDPDYEGCGDGDTYEIECSECEKIFGTTVETSIELNGEGFKMDCKNEGEHSWKIMKWLGKKECRVCRRTEKLLPSELAEYS